ncbi:endonuclease/exonuclease/phosphatase family protein [Gilvimarinus polysaccharolyticus]|uniref:endonuclease/exonuclease/phosphatase family protein n=1 Tax=Gilvimarinus polysaccharolyticus TaxID=863921 RepID=UPI000A0694C6|nr:endonuclease/exonuclease/phosphatase family protein [Gilvimarinus polysaccharolyticus]
MKLYRTCRLVGVLMVLSSAGHGSEMFTDDSAPDTLRVATFNVSMEARNYQADTAKLSAAVLTRELRSANNRQIHHIAEIIQRVRPDILLLNEFDNTAQAGEQADTLTLWQKNYLEVAHQGAEPIHYPYHYRGEVNTGVLLRHDGDHAISAPADAHGFGFYPGHYGMVLLSRYPVDLDAVQTFQKFVWADMPKAARPLNPDGTPFYSDAVWSQLRLSSKSHWDIPLKIGEKTLRVLASHPTPPVFDGPEDRNGARNHDEVRLWLDYISGSTEYLYNDDGEPARLHLDTPFVLLGDLNASAVAGDGRREAITALLQHPRVQDPKPASRGAYLARPDSKESANHTASWGLRADYVLPSTGLTVTGAGVFWPAPDEPHSDLIGARGISSDHRLVWVDVRLGQD